MHSIMIPIKFFWDKHGTIVVGCMIEHVEARPGERRSVKSERVRVVGRSVGLLIMAMAHGGF